ncbi:MAG: hypothetical protein QNJ81_02275 [Acidimicrobiia bacterium]|nr:hypothetical protein [Acidimicrobiia bacterium]
MAGIVNEAYTLDVNVQEAGAAEASVNVRAWNVAETSLIDKTTDAQGDITSTILIAEEHSITLTSTRATTVFNPFKLRALKWLLQVLEVSINLSAPSKQTLFMSVNSNITQTVQATVQAYTGITFSHASDLITLNGLGGAPVDTMDELYDRCQDEAIVNEQFSPAEFISTVDGQNYTSEYDLNVQTLLNGQNRAILFVTGQDFETNGSGNVQDLTLTFQGAGEFRIQSASSNLSNVVINGDLTVNIPANATLTFSGVTVTGDIINAQASFTLTINATDSSLTTSEPGTGPGLVNIVQSVQITFTGVVNDSEVRLFLGDPDNAIAATELDGVESSLGDVPLTYSDTGNGYFVVHKEDYDYILQRLTPLPTSNTSIPIQQNPSRVFENPP